MANAFKNKIATNVGASEVSVYTAPADTTATIIGLSVANTSDDDINVSVRLTDTSESETVYLVKDAPVPVGGSLVVIGSAQKTIVETTDVLKVTSSATGSADVLISMLEQS